MSSAKIDIVFVLPSLKAGGAERVVSFIAQNLDANLFNSVLLVAGKKADCVYDVDGVEVIFFEKRRVLNAIPSLINEIIKRKPQLLFGSIGHINTFLGLLAPLIPKTKIIARIASVSSEIAKFSTGSKFHAVLASLSSKNIDHFICQSRDMKLDFQKHSPGIPDAKVSIINNPITKEFAVKPLMSSHTNHKNLITIGRLSREKGHSRLLTILSNYKHPFHYTIIGDGPLKEELHEQIKQLKLNDKITSIKFTKDIEKYLIKSDLFLQGSYVEGFPNALLESCAVGTPVLAFNAPGGTREIVQHGVNGFLAENKKEFLEYLNKFVKWDPKEIKASVDEKFSQKNIIAQYQALFTSILQQVT